MASQIISGVGPFGFWGLSSLFDPVEALLSVKSITLSSSSSLSLSAASTSVTEPILSENSRIEPVPIRILLVNPSDIRHILSTLTRNRRYRLDSQPIEFYLLETPMEVLARNILLLELFYDSELPIRQRANTFLEVYGNCKVQERTNRYLEQLGNRLRNLIASNTERLQNLIDLSLLKYREKDDLEDCFKSYQSSSFPFDMESYRDHRLRGYYAERYDSRTAVSDWDYHECIRSRASIIHIRQFKDWRNNGIAFEFGDQVYNHSNRTMMAYAEGMIKQGKDKGLKKEVKGFWGDIVNPPYFSFGVDCETNSTYSLGLFEIQNKSTGSEQHRHHTVEVALYNILAMLYEFETGQRYEMKKEHDIFSGLGQDDISTISKETSVVMEKGSVEEILDERELEKLKIDQEAEEKQKNQKKLENKQAAINHIKIFPILGPTNEKLNKPKYENYFDMIFLSSRSAQVMNEDYFGNLLKSSPTSLLAVETAKFFIPLAKPQQKQEYVTRVESYATKHQFQRISAPVPRRHRDELDLEDDVIFFTRSSII